MKLYRTKAFFIIFVAPPLLEEHVKSKSNPIASRFAEEADRFTKEERGLFIYGGISQASMLEHDSLRQKPLIEYCVVHGGWSTLAVDIAALSGIPVLIWPKSDDSDQTDNAELWQSLNRGYRLGTTTVREANFNKVLTQAKKEERAPKLAEFVLPVTRSSARLLEQHFKEFHIKLPTFDKESRALKAALAKARADDANRLRKWMLQMWDDFHGAPQSK